MKRRSKLSRTAVHHRIDALTAARNDGSPAELARLIAPGASYWDCVHGDVDGPERIAALLGDPLGGRDAEVALATVAAEDGFAVAELRVRAASAVPPVELARTEVYRFEDDGIAWCRAYFDPAELAEGRR